MKQTINTIDYKLLLISIKYIPILSAIVLYVHIVLALLCGYESVFKFTFGITLVPAVVVYLAQRTFKFCIIHKLLLWYCVVSDFCLTLHNITLLYSLLIIGTLLFIYFIIHSVRNNAGDNKETTC